MLINCFLIIYSFLQLVNVLYIRKNMYVDISDYLKGRGLPPRDS